ncbi:MAG: hypothetical protein JST32_15135, partial [Bacteroidetes bacterium]|nr:hypothetical protein [Bacteroidota bacterium]
MPYFIRHLQTSALVYLLTLAFSASGQNNRLKTVPGSPSSEIYDLLVDSKGFLWVAHNAGISKYDGIGFTNFSNPLQSSLSTTGLVEDKYGRIWFSNFTGQIFYIQNGHMTLLAAYKSTDENSFPRIGILGDQIIATSRKGIFICDTKSLKCHYEYGSVAGTAGTTSLCILDKRVVLYGNGRWYMYTRQGGLKTVYFGNNTENQLIKASSSTLCARSFHDTVFLFSNPAGLLYKLIISGDVIKICGKKKFESFINTISVTKNTYLINTINKS